jgi:ABC-type iron transport system FetAB permease component
MGNTMTKSSTDLEQICAQMKAAYDQAETSLALGAPKEIREIFSCINRILTTDLPPRLTGVDFDASGTHIEDINTRHELRN